MDIGRELKPLKEDVNLPHELHEHEVGNKHNIMCKTKIYLTCSSIFEKLENFISMELCKEVESSSGLIVDFRKPFNMCKDVGFLSVFIGTFMPSELRDK